MLNLPPDIPAPFADLAVLAARLDAALVIFDADDQTRFASAGMRRVYNFCDFDATTNFEILLRKTWEMGGRFEEAAPPDPDQRLAFARERRKRQRLEFARTQPIRLVCSHIRVSSGWTAQLRVQPERAGLDHYFTTALPITGLTEALRRREEADRCAAALDRVALAVLVTAPDGRVLHANAAASELVERGDGFVIDAAGRLRATDAGVPLARAIAAAAAGGLPNGRVVLHAPGRRPDAPHAVSVTMGADAPGVAAIVAISSPRLDDLAVAKLLRDQYGLTAAEAALAVEVGGGRTGDEASRALGKTPATGREQLHRIFGKMSGAGLLTRGQIELSRWVSVLAAITGAARSRGPH